MSVSQTLQLGQLTGPPYITLVDIDGCPVGVGEKDIPDVQPEPSLADRWPRWTDLIRLEAGRRDDDLEGLQVLMGDALNAVLKQVEWEVDSDAEFDRAWEELEASESEDTGEWPAPISGGSPEADRTESTNVKILATVAAIGLTLSWGGSLLHEVTHEHHRPTYQAPAYTPTPADWESYRDWSEELDRRRSFDAQTEAWNLARARGESWAV